MDSHISYDTLNSQDHHEESKHRRKSRKKFIIITLYISFVICVFLVIMFSEGAQNWLLQLMKTFSDKIYLKYLSVLMVMIFVIIGVPGPIIGIGFGCLINNLWLAALVVCSGKLLGDVVTYFFVKAYLSPYFT